MIQRKRKTRVIPFGWKEKEDDPSTFIPDDEAQEFLEYMKELNVKGKVGRTVLHRMFKAAYPEVRMSSLGILYILKNNLANEEGEK